MFASRSRRWHGVTFWMVLFLASSIVFGADGTDRIKGKSDDANPASVVPPRPGALAFQARVDFFRSVSKRTLAVLAVEFSKSDLKFTGQGETRRALVNLRGGVSDLKGGVVRKLSEEIEWRVPKGALEQPGPALFEWPIELAPGHYKLSLEIEEAFTHNSRHFDQDLDVPNFSGGQLTPSSLMLLRRSPGTVLGRPPRGFTDVLVFTPGVVSDSPGGRGGLPAGRGNAMGAPALSEQVRRGLRGETKGEPSFDGRFTRAERIGVFLQAYNFSLDPRVKKARAVVEYLILRGDQVVFQQSESLGDIPEGKPLTLVKSISLAGVEPGEYVFKIRITDQVRQQTVEPQAKFTVLP